MRTTKPAVAAHFQTEGDLNVSQERERWYREQLNEESQRLIDEDARYFIHQSLSTPCLNVLSRAAGPSIEDCEGRHYYDFHGNSVHQIGFGHPEVVAAVQEVMGQLPFCPRRYTNTWAIRLAKKLAELTFSNLTRMLFVPGGSEAMSVALQLARLSTGRFKTISFWDAFHGCTLDAISIGGESLFRNGVGPLLPGTEHVLPPDPANCPFRCGSACNLACADYVEYVLHKEGDVAAVIGETIRSTGVIPPTGYWQRIKAACDKYGALLILDEISISLGRAGKIFSYQNFGVVPDM